MMDQITLARRFKVDIFKVLEEHRQNLETRNPPQTIGGVVIPPPLPPRGRAEVRNYRRDLARFH